MALHTYQEGRDAPKDLHLLVRTVARHGKTQLQHDGMDKALPEMGIKDETRLVSINRLKPYHDEQLLHSAAQPPAQSYVCPDCSTGEEPKARRQTSSCRPSKPDHKGQCWRQTEVEMGRALARPASPQARKPFLRAGRPAGQMTQPASPIFQPFYHFLRKNDHLR